MFPITSKISLHLRPSSSVSIGSCRNILSSSLKSIKNKHKQIKIPSSLNLNLAVRWHGGPKVEVGAPTVSITFINPHPATARLKGQKGGADDVCDNMIVNARVGETLLQTAQRNDIDLEGACEGVCACSTCHVVCEDENVFDSLEEPSEDEEDMLDMAFALTATSRLGCQIKVREDMDGMVVRVPAATRNFYVDGHVPQPH